MQIHRKYVYLGAQRVHLRIAGEGSPTILLHDWHETSRCLHNVLTHSSGVRWIAPDLPGYGESSSLEPQPAHAQDIAFWLLQLADALDIGSFRILAHGCACSVAHALNRVAPSRILHTSLRREPSGVEIAATIRQGIPRLDPVRSGAHMVEAWSLQRDLEIFDPHWLQDPDHRLRRSLSSPEELHHRTVETLRGRGIGSLLRTAQLAYAENESSAVVFAGSKQVDSAIPSRDPHRVTRFYTDAPHGQVLTRQNSLRSAHPPLILLHASPKSSRELEPLLEGFQQTHAIAFDTPGNGDSAVLPGDTTIPGLAAFFLDHLDRMGIETFDLYGAHTGASIAVEMAIAAPHRVRKMIFDGASLFSAGQSISFEQRYILPIVPEWSGSHLYLAWQLFRNMTLWFPWFEASPANIKPWADPSGIVFHQQFLEFLKGALTYQSSYFAALTYDKRERLPKLRLPLLWCAGPHDVLLQYLEEAPTLVPHVRVQPTGPQASERVALFESFLRS
jgi:pimeloyl-ACP methyl ester carboxylesterase